MVQDLFKRAEIFENISRNGKLNIKGCGLTASTVYKFVYHWRDIGLIEIRKEGRTLYIDLTKKGIDYLEIVKNLKFIKDF